MIGFIIGLFIGMLLGLIGMCLMIVAKDERDEINGK